MNQLPIYIPIVFILTTLCTLILFYIATQKSKKTLYIILIWLTLQAIISKTLFYTVTHTLPPRMLFLIAPPILCIFTLFFTRKGTNFINKINIKYLTYLHTIRIPIECILFLLFIHKTIPKILTFEGSNFDILIGISAPFIAYFGLRKTTLFNKTTYTKKNLLITWNIIGILCLGNVVIHGILSVPTPFQIFGFTQPNIALLYFPFSWLPSFIVPTVLLSHLITIKHLLKPPQESNANP